MRSWRLTLALILLATHALGAFGGVARAADAIVIGVEADLLSEDPARAVRNQVSDLVFSYVYEAFFTPFPGIDGGYQPGLATLGTRPLPRRWEFDLASQHYLDTGVEVTADHLTEALLRLVDPMVGGAGLPANERIGTVTAVESLAADRLVFTLAASSPNLPTLLAREWIAIPHEAGNLMGTGPYRFESWDRGNRVLLTARDPKAEPYYRLAFEVIPSAAARLEAFRTGRVHVLSHVSQSQIVGLRSQNDVNLLLTPSTQTFFLEFNTRRPPFDDPRVRRAVALAINVPAALWEANSGVGYPIGTIVSPATFGYDPSLEPYAYDPDEAKRLLAEAGYPYGFEVEFDFLPHRAEIARIYADMLSEIGIGVHLREWPNWTTLRSELREGDRLVWTGEWDNTSQDPGGVLWAKVGTDGSANYGGYSNAIVDRLLVQADQAGTIEERLAKVQEIQRVLWEDTAMVFEYVVEDVWAVRGPAIDWQPPFRLVRRLPDSYSSGTDYFP